MKEISCEELQQIVATHNIGSRRTLREVLERTETLEDLVSVLARYGGWNQCLKGPGAGLVAQLHRSQDLFGYFEAQEASSGVFEALVDEFRDRHDFLLQAFLEGTAVFFYVSREAVLNLMRHPSVLAAQQKLWEGYGETCYGDLQKLVMAVGFHCGSEFMAAFHEFPELDAFLTERWPEAKKYLETTSIPIGRRNYPAYGWVKDHAEGIELRHFNASLDVFTAIMHAEGETRKYFLDGFLKFLKVQEEFMDVLALPVPF